MNRRRLITALLLAMGLFLQAVHANTIALEEAPPEDTVAAPEYPWLSLSDYPQPDLTLSPLLLPSESYPAPLTSNSNQFVPEPGALSLFVLGLILVLLARIWRVRQKSQRKNNR